MKKFILSLLFTLSLSGCSLFNTDESDALKRVKNNTFSGEQTTWIPHEQYTIAFSDGTYTMTYHKDAVNTKEVKEASEDKQIEGTYSYYDKRTYSWTGDWNAHHSVTYYVIKLSDHVTYENGAYITFQLDSNVIYMNREIPEDKNLGSGQMLVIQK